MPAAVGVPLITPAEERVRPGGREPLETEKVKGPVPPVTVSVWLKAAPTVPLGSVAGLMVIVGQEMTSAKARARATPGVESLNGEGECASGGRGPADHARRGEKVRPGGREPLETGE